MTANFSIGDLVGKEDGDDAIQIRIDNILEDGNKILATVVKLGYFYSSDRLTGDNNSSKGFILGETLEFGLLVNNEFFYTQWIIEKPQNRPWFILGIYEDGIKYFEHYR